MATSTRLICCLSPQIEQRIQAGTDYIKIKDFLISLSKALKGLESQVLLILPYSFKAYLKSDQHLRVACSFLESGGQQSNIIFAPSNKQENCEQEEVAHLFGYENIEVATRKIINLMYKKFFPTILDYEEHQIDKLSCELCKGKEYCSIEMIYRTMNISPSLEAIKKNYPNLIEHFKKTYDLNIQDVTEEQIKLNALMMSAMHGVSSEKFSYIDKIECTKECLEDMKDLKGDEFKNISFSMFRALAYPKLDERAKREQFSIDWHPHSPDRILEYSIHRCDVVNEYEVGKKGESGARRLIIAQNGDTKIFIAYDPEHNIKPEVLLERVKKLPRKAK